MCYLRTRESVGQGQKQFEADWLVLWCVGE
jgi:hypothetical protein